MRALRPGGNQSAHGQLSGVQSDLSRPLSRDRRLQPTGVCH
jgi:hypothetical protein